MDSFYIEDNHSPIVSKEVWDQAQQEMKKRAEAKGNFKGSGKSQNRYPLSGMLFCSKCGLPLRRRTWNSNHSCRKIVWQSQASQVEDRWERREAWRALAGRIAMVSIHVFAKPGFSPRQIANEHTGDLWILRSWYYAPVWGLNVEGETMMF